MTRNAIWKEGREGGASILYRYPSAGELRWIADNHAAVGIRASLLTNADQAGLAIFKERNWELLDEHSSATLKLEPLPTPLAAAKAAIEAVMTVRGWKILYLDSAGLQAFGCDTHRELLRWLGDHHARIWCAPVRDIAEWEKSIILRDQTLESLYRCEPPVLISPGSSISSISRHDRCPPPCDHHRRSLC